MSATLPTLSAGDLEEELEMLHKGRRRTRTTAFYGAPAPGLTGAGVTATVLDDDGVRARVRFRVVHATCELEVRKALAAVGDGGGAGAGAGGDEAGAGGDGAPGEDESLVLLVDFDGRLPLDVTGRLASGKVRYVTEERRLARLFGARAVSPEVLVSPLKDALLAESGYERLPGATLSLDTAWRHYLHRMADLPADAALSEERVVAHCAGTGDVRGLGRVLAERRELADALYKYLKDRVGRVARLAWRAWTQGRGAEVAAFAFVLQGAEVAAARSEYLEAWLGLHLAALDPELQGVLSRRGGTDKELLRRWGALADGLVRHLKDEGVEPILRVADRLVAGDERVAEALAGSPYLACALDGAREALAGALERALAVVSGPGAAADAADAVRAVREAFERLEGHRLSGRVPYRSQLERARMAARLVAYLAAAHVAERAGDAAPVGGAPGDEVARLAAAYACAGGFVDLARSRARGPRADRLDAAVAAVVACADQARDGQDEAFARALPHWLRHRRTDRAVPVDMALDRFAVDFLAEQKSRRLLVLLMDGMAWASAVELLLDLEGERHGPVRWQPGKAGGELLPPMLAALPTLTHVSRSALFAGKLVAPGARADTTRDPDRFDGHTGLRKLLGHGPALLLRTRGEERPGHVSGEALALIASDARVVGLVVNAIDDALDGAPGLHVELTHRTIKALPDVLAAASQAGRAVLLLADHGHVLADRFGPPLPSSERLGARCRELAEGEEPGPGEVVVEGEAAWRRSARRRLAMLYRETDTYSVVSGRGAHGGASLAEVVAPAVLIASEDLAERVRGEDPAMDLRPFPRPRWWDMDVAAAAAETAAAPAARPARRTRSSPQLALPVVAPPAPAPAPVADAGVGAVGRGAGQSVGDVRPPSRWAEMLRASEEYRTANKRERDYWDSKLVPAVDLLAEHGGMLPAAQLATRMGELPFRVGGLVAALAERVNLEQHPVLVHDPRAGQVRLDLALLEQLFGA